MLSKIIAILKRIFAEEGGAINYLSGAEALPRPYTADEEQELVSRLGGDDDNVRQELIEHNLRLVVYIAIASRRVLDYPNAMRLHGG